MCTMMKTRKDNNVVDRTNAVYVKNDTKFSWLIGPSEICDENQTK